MECHKGLVHVAHMKVLGRFMHRLIGKNGICLGKAMAQLKKKT